MRPYRVNLLLFAWALTGCTIGGNGGGSEGTEGARLQQADFLALVKAGKNEEAFKKAFEAGDKLFETEFTAEQGVGAMVGNNQRFTRVPRADLAGPGEWFTHRPERPTGPNAQSCNGCHDRPADDGAGSIAVNVHRDPQRTGQLKDMIQRNTPHLFGPGALQRLAEEMTAELQGIRKAVVDAACSTGQRVERPLTTKTVDFGYIAATCPKKVQDIDDSRIVGVAPDLVIRPFQWKKSVIFLRDFTRGAAHNELGMQGVELVGAGKDGDGDGVTDELTIGQITALSVYMAAQPRPVTKTELAQLGLISLSLPEREAIARGEQVFGQIGCGTCHKPSLPLVDPIHTEPSQAEDYRDAVFASGQDPISEGVDWNHPIRFDLSKDQPDNRVTKDGQEIPLGSFTEKNAQGQIVIRLYGDLKRHDLGPEIAESIDELGNGRMTPIQYLGGVPGSGAGASTFGTKELWGVGCTGPWLHDGRATTLVESIEFHGGEAAKSREDFRRLEVTSQKDLVAFLQNLVLVKKELEGIELSPVCTPEE